MAPWIRIAAYIVSMSELIILAKIIWDWKQCLSTYRKSAHCQTCNFMLAADVWIVINLVLAIIMSIPAANIFTHGTHITVAHAMGTTIGINTMILLASVFFVLEKGFRGSLSKRQDRVVMAGFWLANLSLFAFFGALVWAGYLRGTAVDMSFFETSALIRPYLTTFAASGAGLLCGLQDR